MRISDWSSDVCSSDLDAELEQYPEGKYDGEFVIRYIFAKSYPVAGGARFEVRANLDGMTLNGIDKLSRDEARSFATQEVDPLDEEQGTDRKSTRLNSSH